MLKYILTTMIFLVSIDASAKLMKIHTPTDDIVLRSYPDDPNIIYLEANHSVAGSFNLNQLQGAKSYTTWKILGAGGSTLVSGALATVTGYIAYWAIKQKASHEVIGIAGASSVLALASGVMTLVYTSETHQVLGLRSALGKVLSYFRGSSERPAEVNTSAVFSISDTGTVYVRDTDSRLQSVEYMWEFARITSRIALELSGNRSNR